MAEYQKIEYRIAKDGKITETVIDGTGQSCTDTTANIEKALGKVEYRELFPEYYQVEENQVTESTQSSTQM